MKTEADRIENKQATMENDDNSEIFSNSPTAHATRNVTEWTHGKPREVQISAIHRWIDKSIL